MEFFNKFDHTIDDKGRLVLPSAYRSAFAEGGYLTYMGASAGLFTEDEFEKYRRKITLSGVFSRKDLQQLMALTTPVQPDAQHRVPISQGLRDRVQLGREVTVAGQGSHVEIFPREVWMAREAESLVPDDTGKNLATKFDDLDFL
jgi:MraZ protein